MQGSPSPGRGGGREGGSLLGGATGEVNPPPPAAAARGRKPRLRPAPTACSCCCGRRRLCSCCRAELGFLQILRIKGDASAALVAEQRAGPGVCAVPTSWVAAGLPCIMGCCCCCCWRTSQSGALATLGLFCLQKGRGWHCVLAHQRAMLDCALHSGAHWAVGMLLLCYSPGLASCGCSKCQGVSGGGKRTCNIILLLHSKIIEAFIMEPAL